jgi:hypothetical protein
MTTVDQPITEDKEVFVGEDKDLRWSIKDDAGGAKDISGWTFLFQLRLRRSSADLILGKAGSIEGSPALGIAKVLIASTDLDDVKPGTYFYGLARTNAGAWDVVAEGEFVLRKAAVHV